MIFQAIKNSWKASNQQFEQDLADAQQLPLAAADHVLGWFFVLPLRWLVLVLPTPFAILARRLGLA